MRTGRPKKEPAEELRARIDDYFSSCEEQGRYPTESGMILYLGLTPSEYEKRLVDKAHGQVLASARLRRVDWLENRMVTEGKNATGCMNALRHERYDAGADDAESLRRTLTVIMDGVGGSAAE